MRLIQNTALLIIICFAVNALYTYFPFSGFVQKHADQYGQVMKIKDCDIIYVSASSNFPPRHLPENDPRKISQFLGDYFPSMRTEAINKPASHAGIYLPLLKTFPENAEAKVFVVTMNLRTFGADWIHSELETPLQQSAVFYNQRPALLNRLLFSLNDFDNQSVSEREAARNQAWDQDLLPFSPSKQTVSSWCAIEKWGDWQDPKRQLADQFIKQYAFVIDDDNPRVCDFDAICALAHERGWTLVFNLLAENTLTADSLAGYELVQLMDDNAAWLVDRYEARGFRVVNNLHLLAPYHFTDKDFPTEHYDEFGRKAIAREVARALIEVGVKNE